MNNKIQISNLYFQLDTSQELTKQKSAIENHINNLTYELFCRNKFKKPFFDLYVLFSPFNEASRAFYPFINHLKKH